MAINKKDVRTLDDIQRYLQESTKKSLRLYHYTTYESLVSILKNRCFRLSRMDLLNDKAEQTLGKQDKHLKNYIMSFTRDKEYISMWAMYGKASGIKIRLDFPCDLFKQCINNNFYLDTQKEQRMPLYTDVMPGHFSKKEFLISDVVYIDKSTGALRHNENEFENIKADESIVNDLTGFIKYDAWEFEREIRLRVLLYNNIETAQQNKIIPQYIFAGIDDNLINDFHVTFNPWLPSEVKDELKKSINGLIGHEIEYSNSQHDGEVAEL